MSITTRTGAAALVATMALALPSSALARGGGERDGRTPSRIATKVKAADRALDRAQERAEDGNAEGAASSLSAVRTNLASALRSAKKRIVAGNATGAPSAAAVGRADHVVVGGTAAMFDGRSGALVDAIAATLDAALDNRDELIAVIAALENRSAYTRVLARFGSAVDAETEDIGEALADDELTGEAKAALNAALTRLQATAAAIDAAGGSASARAQGEGEGADYAAEGERDGKCKEGGRGPGAGGPGTGYEDQGGSREQL